MVNVTDLVFAEQFGHLRQVAEHRGWPLMEIPGPGFQLVLPARDGAARFGLHVLCDGYLGVPPAWRWCDPDTGAPVQTAEMPAGDGGYFHSSGRICAPWNRLAYSQVDPQGPHGDWELSTWITNPKTGSCITLTAMALRIAVELQSPRYRGRRG